MAGCHQSCGQPTGSDGWSAREKEKEKKKARAGGSRRSRNYISFKYTKLLYSSVKNNHVINILYCV
jgi:beta-glucanase (GH16 family)